MSAQDATTKQKYMKSSATLPEFQRCTQLKYNGKLVIKSSQGNKNWSFYYRLGQIVWATNGTHTYRRLRRQIAQNCPQIELNQIQLLPEELTTDYWDYRLLEKLYQTKQITKEQVNKIVGNIIGEVLFDLAQNLNFGSVKFERNQEIVLEGLEASTTANIFLKQMQESWQNWTAAGLGKFSPNSAPVLRKPEQLKQQVSPTVYKNFENLAKGKYSLWDIAAKMKQNILPVTHSLLPYIHQGITELIEIPDLPLPVTQAPNKNLNSDQNSNTPLVVCVDDSPQICKILEQIITSQGMRFMSIQDPVSALPTLIQTKPDLIFLDLIMPVVNGYEICAQLRRSTLFADTPIMILTSSDGVFDRVRSKVFGATEFITKPVEVEKVVGTIDKYLRTKPLIESFSNLAFC
ncbi:MAG TPA: response regulator [Nostocaceae cyanobacterium]|nr:response regulator [Nostocaceae cyanobacterium]